MIRRMELRHIRYFIAAAEEEHFGRAADRLHVTRPAVSQIVADLEDELGTPLFERLGHRVRLTAAGRTLLPQVQAMMKHLNQAITITRQVGQGRIGALNIGYGSLTLLHPLFRAAVKAFHEHCPEVTLSLLEVPSVEQPKALAEGRLHLGFTHFNPDQPHPRDKKQRSDVMAQEVAVQEYLEIQRNGLGLVVPADHRLARLRSIKLNELANERWVVIPHSTVSPGYGPLFSLCQKAGFEPHVVQEVHSITTLLNLVSVGVGIGLTVTGKGFSFPPSLAVLEIEGVSHRTTFALTWVKGNIEPPLARFIEIVKQLM